MPTSSVKCGGIAGNPRCICPRDPVFGLYHGGEKPWRRLYPTAMCGCRLIAEDLGNPRTREIRSDGIYYTRVGKIKSAGSVITCSSESLFFGKGQEKERQECSDLPADCNPTAALAVVCCK